MSISASKAMGSMLRPGIGAGLGGKGVWIDGSGTIVGLATLIGLGTTGVFAPPARKRNVSTEIFSFCRTKYPNLSIDNLFNAYNLHL